MGQRLDIELDLPSSEGAFPILALREGERERTGIILATQGARVERLADLGEAAAPAFDWDLAQEGGLRASAPLPQRAATRRADVMLGGTMSPYLWTINDRVWGAHEPLPHGVRSQHVVGVELGFILRKVFYTVPSRLIGHRRRTGGSPALLALAHDRGCEAELAAQLEGGISARTVCPT